MGILRKYCSHSFENTAAVATEFLTHRTTQNLQGLGEPHTESHALWQIRILCGPNKPHHYSVWR